MSKNQNIDVIYEDNHLIAINKRSGDLVHDDETGDLTLLEKVKEYIKVKYNKPGAVFLAAVHRLDRPVSGVVVFARTSKALERMNVLFKDREMTKVYWAIVLDYPQESEQTLVHFIKKDTEKNSNEKDLVVEVQVDMGNQFEGFNPGEDAYCQEKPQHAAHEGEEDIFNDKLRGERGHTRAKSLAYADL